MSTPTEQTTNKTALPHGADTRMALLWVAAGFNLLLSMAGSWPQRIEILGGRGYGRLWTIGVVLLAAAAIANRTTSRGLWVSTSLFSVPVLVGVGHMVADRTGAGQLLLQSWLAIPLAMLVGHGMAARRPSVDRHELHIKVRWAAALLAGSALSSRLIGLALDVSGSYSSFGLTAGVAFVAIAAVTNRPTDVLTDPAAWVALAGFVLSPSRAAWLCAVLGMAVLVALRWDRYQTNRAKALVAAGLLTALVLTPMAGLDRLTKVASTADPTAGREVLSGRSIFWGETFDEAWNAPIVGHGPGAGNEFVAEVPGSRAAQPHNGYLRLLFDVGLVGLGGFVAAMVVLAVGLWSARGDDLASGALALGVGLTVALFFTNVATFKEVMVPAGLFIGLATVGAPCFAPRSGTITDS